MNKEIKHTPGPWNLTKCPCGHPSCSYYGTDNGHFPQGAGYSLDDARLIAAIPMWLKALEQIRHSSKQASIAGNDWKRELALIENTGDSAIDAAREAKS